MLIVHTVDSEHLYNLQVVLVWEHWHGIFTHTIIATVAMVMVTVEREGMELCIVAAFTDELTTKKYYIFVGFALPVAITNYIIHSHLKCGRGRLSV